MDSLQCIRQSASLHGGAQVHLLTPRDICDALTIAGYPEADYAVYGNGSGYAFLRGVLSVSRWLRTNEVLLLPMPFAYEAAFRRDWPSTAMRFSHLILINYCTCQLAPKDLVLAVKTKTKSTSSPVLLRGRRPIDYVPDWKTEGRLTVKAHGPYMLWHANADVFTSMADSCERLAECGDDSSLNDIYIHYHHDMCENTSRSLGISFYLWQAMVEPLE